MDGIIKDVYLQNRERVQMLSVHLKGFSCVQSVCVSLLDFHVSSFTKGISELSMSPYEE